MLKRYPRKGQARGFKPDLEARNTSSPRGWLFFLLVIAGTVAFAGSVPLRMPQEKRTSRDLVRIRIHEAPKPLIRDVKKEPEAPKRIFDQKELTPKVPRKKKRPVKIRPKKRRRHRIARPQKARTPEKKPSQETSRPVKEVFGLNPKAVAKGGAVAARVGNTLMKAPQKEFTPPDKVKQIEDPPDEVFQEDGVDRPPRFARRVVPVYPEEAQEEGIEGEVVITAVVSERGRVLKIEKVQGPGFGLNKAAVRALLRSRFIPALYRGRPVRCRIRVPYRFTLE